MTPSHTRGGVFLCQENQIRIDQALTDTSGIAAINASMSQLYASGDGRLAAMASISTHS